MLFFKTYPNQNLSASGFCQHPSFPLEFSTYLLSVKTLLESKNSATVEVIARAFLQDDTSQIDYYKQITKNMPGKVLRKNKVVTYQDDKFILNAPNFTDEQRKKLIKICNEKVKKYQEKYGEKIWIHRARA